MPIALYLTPLFAGLSWAVWRAFGGSLTGRPAPRGPIEPLPIRSRAVLASFAAGFGASGASVRLFGHVSPASELALAAATGILVAGFVRSAVALAAGPRGD